MDGLLIGWLRCTTGRDAPVAITTAQREQLDAKTLPCPGCAEPCAPTFELTRVSADVRLTSWRDGAWRNGFVLRD